MHVGVECSGTTGAWSRAVFFLISIKLVLFVCIGGLGLLQAVDETRQLIKERPIAIELEVERCFDWLSNPAIVIAPFKPWGTIWTTTNP